MMVEEINELWDARPFQPFEVAMADGAVFTVTSPKLMLLTPSLRTMHLVTPEGKSRWLALSQMTRVSVAHSDDLSASSSGGAERK
jgi:hypothetical protein